jgi:hypothetical protein
MTTPTRTARTTTHDCPRGELDGFYDVSSGEVLVVIVQWRHIFDAALAPSDRYVSQTHSVSYHRSEFRIPLRLVNVLLF